MGVSLRKEDCFSQNLPDTIALEIASCICLWLLYRGCPFAILCHAPMEWEDHKESIPNPLFYPDVHSVGGAMPQPLGNKGSGKGRAHQPGGLEENSNLRHELMLHSEMCSDRDTASNPITLWCSKPLADAKGTNYAWGIWIPALQFPLAFVLSTLWGREPIFFSAAYQKSLHNWLLMPLLYEPCDMDSPWVPHFFKTGKENIWRLNMGFM